VGHFTTEADTNAGLSVRSGFPKFRNSPYSALRLTEIDGVLRNVFITPHIVTTHPLPMSLDYCLTAIREMTMP